MGEPFHTEVTESTVTYYFLDGCELVTASYCRRSTVTTWSRAPLPRSLR